MKTKNPPTAQVIIILAGLAAIVFMAYKRNEPYKKRALVVALFGAIVTVYVYWQWHLADE